MALAATTETRKSRGRWQWSLQAKASAKVTIPILLWTLHELGGVIEDSKGQCVLKLLKMAAERGYVVHPTHRLTNPRGVVTVGSLFRELAGGRYGDCIARDTHDKRTYKITLLLTEDELPPKPFPVKVTKLAPVKQMTTSVQSVPDPDPTPEPDIPEPEPQPEPVVQPELTPVDKTGIEDVVVTTIPPVLTVDADDDAFALILEATTTLTRALIAINQTPRNRLGGGPSDVDIDEAAKRMADTLAENTRLRRKMNDLAETVQAKTRECDGLRKALMATTANLKALQVKAEQADQRERAMSRFRDVERTMQAPPSARR